MDPIKSRHPAIGVVHLGLMGQLHYVSLHRDSTSVSGEANAHHQSPAYTHQQTQTQPQHVHARPVQQCPLAAQEQEKREQAEDDEAFHCQAQLRGLPYDTVMQREDNNVSADNIFSVAPTW